MHGDRVKAREEMKIQRCCGEQRVMATDLAVVHIYK